MTVANTLLIAGFFLLFTSCYNSGNQFDIDEARKSFAEGAEEHNRKVLEWDSLIQSLYSISDTNPSLALKEADRHLDWKNNLSDHNRTEIIYIKGTILMNIDSFEQAARLYTIALNETGYAAPKYLGKRAGCYMKLGELDKALEDLNRAAEVNHSYLHHIGNYYEVIGQKDSAIKYYLKLYSNDTVFYKKYQTRALDLKESRVEMFTEIQYENDRDRKYILLSPVK